MYTVQYLSAKGLLVRSDLRAKDNCRFTAANSSTSVRALSVTSLKLNNCKDKDSVMLQHGAVNTSAA
jgi:hypothetical protein